MSKPAGVLSIRSAIAGLQTKLPLSSKPFGAAGHQLSSGEQWNFLLAFRNDPFAHCEERPAVQETATRIVTLAQLEALIVRITAGFAIAPVSASPGLRSSASGDGERCRPS